MNKAVMILLLFCKVHFVIGRAAFQARLSFCLFCFGLLSLAYSESNVRNSDYDFN